MTETSNYLRLFRVMPGSASRGSSAGPPTPVHSILDEEKNGYVARDQLPYELSWTKKRMDM